VVLDLGFGGDAHDLFQEGFLSVLEFCDFDFVLLDFPLQSELFLDVVASLPDDLLEA
jgi:hypothetical protein